MRMSKVKAEALLEFVKKQLTEANKEAKDWTSKAEALKCSKAYLEFIITGLKKNPSLKIDVEDGDE